MKVTFARGKWAVNRGAQVINAGRDDEVRHVVADSFTGFMGFLAEQFERGRVQELSGSERIVIDGEGRNFVQSLPYLLSPVQAG